jgi:hypothetical protein
LQKINWQTKAECSEEEQKELQMYLTEAPQSFQSNYWSLKWLLNNSLKFIQTVGKTHTDKFITMKKRIFFLTGEDGYDRLELSNSTLLKMGIFYCKQIIEQQNANSH